MLGILSLTLLDKVQVEPWSNVTFWLIYGIMSKFWLGLSFYICGEVKPEMAP